MQKEERLRILLLEDNRQDIELIERTLKRDGISFESEHADTEVEFHHALHHFKPDIILSDHGLPQFNSIQALKICQSEKLSAPFILVTGNVSEEFAISSLQQGAADYILKSDLSRLPSAVRKALKNRKLDTLRRDARKELRTRNRHLIKTNKELDNFVHSLSLNLRDPLVSMAGLLRLAKLEDKEGKLSSLHKMMDQSISKLDEILKEMIDYSQNARNEVKVEEIQWEDLVAEHIDKLAHLSPEPITKNISADDVPFFSDKARLSSILQNILSNSILYQDRSKGLYLFIRVFVTPQNATLVISDNGIGIPEPILPKVFDMFYRGTELSKGVGLGLYNVKEMVARLGGKISLTSVAQEGTTCVISLPNAPIMP